METINQVKVVCAYCPKYGREIAVIKEGNTDKGLSHGICKVCFAAEKESFQERKLMKTMNEMKRLINKEGFIRHNTILFAVTVLDVREVYGRLQYLIKPTNGEGLAWINEDSLLKGQVNTNESNAA